MIPTDKKCSKCLEVLPSCKFWSWNNKGRLRLQSVCKKCKRKSPESSIETPPENTKKFCHNCWKWKVLGEYRKFRLGKSRASTVHSNRCIICEDIHGIEKNGRKFINRHIDEWQCIVIGNKPYKEICDIFKITHNETASGSRN